MKLAIKATPTFDKLHKAYQAGKHKIIILKGGSRSGKTYAIIQLLIILAYSTKQPMRITAWRTFRKTAKDTIYNDFIKYAQSIELYNPKHHNQSELKYKINNSEIEFSGLEDHQKLHGLTSDIVWINEAIETSKNSFDQLEMRTNQLLIIDCNPSEEQHWIYDLDKRDDVITLTSTFQDNSFIQPAVRNKILSYEPTPQNIRQGTADKYMWQVYGLGIAAQKEGLIFPNYQIIEEYPEEANTLGYGLDFGFHPDPTAFARIGMYNGKLVLDELIYENNLNNVIIAGQEHIPSIQSKFIELGITHQNNIIADSAAKSNISELKTAGYNIEGVKKYPGSVNDGLELMKNYMPFYVTQRSNNAIKELKNYTYKKNPYTGTFTNQPIDQYNHLIDLFRYVVQTKINAHRPRGIKKLSY